MSQTVKGAIADAGEALTLIERLSESPLNVILIVIICLLTYALYKREKSYISVNKKLGRAKSILTGLLSHSEKIDVIEAEKRVYDLLENKS